MFHPRLISSVLALLLSTSVQATDKESNWYLSGEFGSQQSKFWQTLKSFDLPDTEPATPVDEDFNDGFNIEGGYHFGRFFSVELGFRDYSKTELADFNCNDPSDLSCFDRALESDSRMSSYSLSLVPRWPVNKNLSLYGKLGVVDWVIESDDFSRLDYNNLQYGMGIRYDFTNDFGVLIEYEAVDTEMDATSLGLSWRF